MNTPELAIDDLTLAVNRLADLIEKQVNQKTDAVRQWREKNPQLSQRCKQGAVKFVEVMNGLLEDMLLQVEDEDGLNSFTLGEFIDKFGPRLVHLNNLVQTLTTLGGG